MWRCMALDGSELAGDAAVDQAGGDAVEPGEESFGEAEVSFSIVA